MNNISELCTRMPELLDHVKDKGKEFDEWAVEIINEIADYAEKTKMYKENVQKYTKSRDIQRFDEMSAEELWHHLLLKVVGAPTRMHLISVPIILMPML